MQELHGWIELTSSGHQNQTAIKAAKCQRHLLIMWGGGGGGGGVGSGGELTEKQVQ